MRSNRLFFFSLYGLLCILTGTLWLSSGYIRVMVSDSMAPAYRTGDLVVILPAQKPLAAGSVIGYQSGEQFVLHRIQIVTAKGIVTKGDNNRMSDPWIIQNEDILGVPVIRLPLIGHILLTNPSASVKTWLLVSPLIGLILVILLRMVLFRPDKWIHQRMQES